MNGKGSTSRPLSISRKKFEANWEDIFGKKNKVAKDKQEKNKRLKKNKLK